MAIFPLTQPMLGFPANPARCLSPQMRLACVGVIDLSISCQPHPLRISQDSSMALGPNIGKFQVGLLDRSSLEITVSRRSTLLGVVLDRP